MRLHFLCELSRYVRLVYYHYYYYTRIAHFLCVFNSLLRFCYEEVMLMIQCIFTIIVLRQYDRRDQTILTRCLLVNIGPISENMYRVLKTKSKTEIIASVQQNKIKTYKRFQMNAI